MGDKLRYAILGACTAAGVALGLLGGWAIWGKPGPTVGGPAPEQRQADGSVVLERQPAQEAPREPHKPPPGGTVERLVTVEIQPAAPCPRLHVDLSVVRMPDGSSRVVASSPDGEVSGGVDVPIERAIVAAQQKPWAAGVSYAGDRAWGVFVHREIWRIRAGLEVNATTDGGAEARAMVGITW